MTPNAPPPNEEGTNRVVVGGECYEWRGTQWWFIGEETQHVAMNVSWDILDRIAELEQQLATRAALPDGGFWVRAERYQALEADLAAEIVRLRQQLAAASAETEQLREELGDVIEQWADLLPHASISAELHARMLASAKAAMAKRVIAPNAPPAAKERNDE